MTAQKLKILLFGTSAEPSSVCWNCTLKSQSPSVLATNIERKYTNYLYVTHCNIYVCSCVSTKVFKMTSMMQFAVVQPVHATIDGARAALEYTESNAVNTSRVLLLPGDHSGFETIQNHLATLSPELAITATPSTSSDVAQAMWATAWTAAQVKTMVQSKKLAAQQDAVALKLATIVQDVAALIDTVNEQTTQLNLAVTSRAVMQAAYLTDFEKAKAGKVISAEVPVELARELECSRANLVTLRADTDRNTELAECGRKLTCQELVQLIDKIGELIVALDIPVYAAPAVVAPCSAD